MKQRLTRAGQVKHRRGFLVWRRQCSLSSLAENTDAGHLDWVLEGDRTTNHRRKGKIFWIYLSPSILSMICYWYYKVWLSNCSFPEAHSHHSLLECHPDQLDLANMWILEGWACAHSITETALTMELADYEVEEGIPNENWVGTSPSVCGGVRSETEWYHHLLISPEKWARSAAVMTLIFVESETEGIISLWPSD